jgi:hypothetical protein
MLYFLVTAMYPRFLITVDEELNSSPVTVHVERVGRLCWRLRYAIILMRLYQALARKIDRVVHVS